MALIVFIKFYWKSYTTQGGCLDDKKQSYESYSLSSLYQIFLTKLGKLFSVYYYSNRLDKQKGYLASFSTHNCSYLSSEFRYGCGCIFYWYSVGFSFAASFKTACFLERQGTYL